MPALHDERLELVRPDWPGRRSKLPTCLFPRGELLPAGISLGAVPMDNGPGLALDPRLKADRSDSGSLACPAEVLVFFASEAKMSRRGCQRHVPYIAYNLDGQRESKQARKNSATMSRRIMITQYSARDNRALPSS